MENLKTFVKGIFKSVTFKLIVVIAIILVLLAAIIYYITIDDATYKEGDMSNTPYVSSKYQSSVKFSGEGIKFSYVNPETNLEEEKTSSEMAKILWEEMMKTKTSVKNYLDTVEELEKLMNAEIITQYPKLPGDNIDLNGTVVFKRHKKGEGEEKPEPVILEYIDKSTFDSYIEDQNLDVINYFTLDENHQLLIGIINTTTEELEYNDSDVVISDLSDMLTKDDKLGEGNYKKVYHKVIAKTLNYKELISKYTMPFQYLWSFIVIGDDKGVGLELADLVEDSEIIVSIYDNITTTVEKNEYTYNKQRKANVTATATCSTNYGDSQKTETWKPAAEWEDEEEYFVNYTMTYEANLNVFDVSKADVWIVNYSRDCEYQSSTLVSEFENKKCYDDPEYVVDEAATPTVSSGNGLDLPYNDKFKDKLDELKNNLENEVRSNTDLAVVDNEVVELVINSTEITSCKADYFKHNININKTKTDTKYEQKYIPKTPINNPKIQKKTEEELRTGTGKDNFVTILSDAKHSQARNKLTFEIYSWLMELLETNDDTKDMIDITNYLFFVVTEKDRYGINEYDFYVYESDSFTSVTGSVYGDEIYGNLVYGDSIQEKVWYMLKDMGYSDIAAAGAMGNIHYESGSFNPSAIEGGYTEETGGIGICQWTNNARGPTGRNKNLRDFAASRGVTWQDENIQVEFLRGELLPGGGADGYASYQLLSMKIYYGSELACPSAWKNATSVEDATMAFCYSFERPGKDYARTSMSRRINYAKQYYDLYSNMQDPPVQINTTLTGENKSKMQSMISQAILIAKDNRYGYSLTDREGQYNFDCASFVARLYTQFFGIPRLDKNTSEEKVTYSVRYNCINRYNARKIENLSDLQPGDIVWVPGHVALYIGNGSIVHASGPAGPRDNGSYRTKEQEVLVADNWDWMRERSEFAVYRIIY